VGGHFKAYRIQLAEHGCNLQAKVYRSLFRDVGRWASTRLHMAWQI
jgi:hypothetical protein